MLNISSFNDRFAIHVAEKRDLIALFLSDVFLRTAQ